jgi:site-specific recombinase XerD
VVQYLAVDVQHQPGHGVFGEGAFGRATRPGEPGITEARDPGQPCGVGLIELLEGLRCRSSVVETLVIHRWPAKLEIRRFKPSTVSRRFSVAAGFYRTCVIDGVLEHSPAEHVRRPAVAAESPTLGFTHLQFEALLTAARDSGNRYDFALVAMLGLLVIDGS